MTASTKLAPLSDAEKDAVLAHQNGADLSTISALTGLGRVAIERAVERDKLIRLNGPKLAPLNQAEAEAVRLHGLRTPTAIVAARTGLTVEQVRAAIERDKLLRLVPGARNRPSAPTPLPLAHTPAAAALPEPEIPNTPKATGKDKEAPAVPVTVKAIVDDRPAEPADDRPCIPAPEPVRPTVAEEPAAEPVDDRPVIAVDLGAVDEPAPPSTEELLARAEASPQQRVRTVAAAIRTQLAHLATLMDNDERVRTLTATTEVLREQLAKAERELAELLGDAGAAPDTHKTVDWDAALADGPDEQPAAREPGDAELSYSAEVRAWGKANGWDIRPSGRIAGAVVAAYRKAHPTGGAS